LVVVGIDFYLTEVGRPLVSVVISPIWIIIIIIGPRNKTQNSNTCLQTSKKICRSLWLELDSSLCGR
jgi:hypothetical protein